MRLELLAKDAGSGEQGCPSVHRDHDSDSPLDLVVQGDGIRLAPGPKHGHAAVRIAASIVADGLRTLGWRSDDGREFITQDLVVTGPEIDIALLPNPLPGEKAVRVTAGNLNIALGGLRMDRLAEQRAMVRP